MRHEAVNVCELHGRCMKALHSLTSSFVSLTCVNPDVPLELARLVKLLLTHVAFVHFLHSSCSKVIVVCHQMLSQFILVFSDLVTDLENNGIHAITADYSEQRGNCKTGRSSW